MVCVANLEPAESKPAADAVLSEVLNAMNAIQHERIAHSRLGGGGRSRGTGASYCTSRRSRQQ